MVEKQSLYILGGNPTISEILRRKSSRLRNFEVVVVDSRPFAQAHQYADRSVYEDPRGFVQKLKLVGKSKVLPTASDISAEAFLDYYENQNDCGFDLTGWRELLDKTTMVKALDLPGEQSRLLYSTASKNTNLKKVLDKSQDLEKLVVKPNKASGGRGFKVVNQGANLADELALAASFSNDGEAVLERYIRIMHQFCGDMYVLNGMIQSLFIGDGIWNHAEGKGYPIGEVFQTRKSYLKRDIESELRRLILKLGITEGIFNFDAIVDDEDVVRVLEMAPRPGGNHLSYAASLAEGVDYEAEYLEYFLGIDIARSNAMNYETVVVTMVGNSPLLHQGLKEAAIRPDFERTVRYNTGKSSGDGVSMDYLGSTISGFSRSLTFADCARYRNLREAEFRKSTKDV